MCASGVGQQRHAPRNDTYLSHVWCLPRAEADVLPLQTHHKSPREPPGSAREEQSHQGLLQAEQQPFNPAPHSHQLQLLPRPAGSSSGTQQGGTPLGGTCKLQAPSSWASWQGTESFPCLVSQRAARLTASSTFMWLARSSKWTQP